MSESLRNDGRVWVQDQKTPKSPRDIPESERDYYLERRYPALEISCLAIASRAAKVACDEGRGVGLEVDGERRGVYWISRTPLAAWVRMSSKNATVTYSKCTNGLLARTHTQHRCGFIQQRTTPWVDFGWITTLKQLFLVCSRPEKLISRTMGNRLGASALMQGLADGYFVVPYTVGNFLALERMKSRKTTQM